MNTIFDVVADRDDGQVQSFGARRSRADAEAHLAEEKARYDESSWRNFRIEEVDATGLFEIPSRPTPPNYTATSVMDLESGEIVAGEEPSPGGFCPVGFYVPDWWDIHEPAEKYGTLPGSRIWTRDHEWPTGEFGFVWGCVWGDDSSWKVQYLGLSQLREGVLTREERFGYVILDTGESEGGEVWRDAREFIQLWSYDGCRRVDFRTRQTFDLNSGELRGPLE